MSLPEEEWKRRAAEAFKTSKNGGIKFDDDKPDYSLIPPNALDDVVKVLTIGAKKYDRHNWKKLDNIDDRYFAAAQRHMWALMKDEELDPETGEHHAAHAICCMMFLLEFYYLQKPKNKV
tara:strand:- start:1866 stop:2225 length:360 start_codon:yes stop_codon:yes gene_type:complete